MTTQTLKFDDGLAELLLASRAFAEKDRVDERLLLAIAGGSMSGKSFLAAKLQKGLSEIGVASALVPLDAYFRDKDDPALPRTESGRPLMDIPASYHGEDFVKDVMSLLRGESALIPRYEKASLRRLSERLEIRPGKIVIAEGLFAITFLRHVAQADYGVYTEAAHTARRTRRIAHDMENYGVTEEKVRAVFETVVTPCHERYVAPQRSFADLVVTTS